MSEERTFPNWEQLYQQSPVDSLPWTYPSLDPDLGRALVRWNITSGKLLDLGTGPATQALALAERGFDVTGSDLSTTAVDKAIAEAKRRGVAARFVQDDVLNSRIAETFDAVFDRGCFHTLPPNRRSEYVLTARRLVAPEGHLFLKVFSEREPGDQGPYRFSPEQIQSVFGSSFEILSIEETFYQGNRTPQPHALFCTMRPR